MVEKEEEQIQEWRVMQKILSFEQSSYPRAQNTNKINLIFQNLDHCLEYYQTLRGRLRDFNKAQHKHEVSSPKAVDASYKTP